MNVVFGRTPPYFILLKWADILKNPNHFRGGPDSTTCIWKIMPPLKISAEAGIQLNQEVLGSRLRGSDDYFDFLRDHQFLSPQFLKKNKKRERIGG